MAHQVTSALAARRSVRVFEDRLVEKAHVAELLTLAGRAPSGINAQPWKITVVTGDRLCALTEAVTRAAIANPRGENPTFDIYPDPMPVDVKTRYIALGAQMYGAMGIGRADIKRRQAALLDNFRFFGAPVGLIVTLREDLSDYNQWAYVGMYLQSLALLCVERGLGTCMQEAWAQYHETVKQTLHIAETDRVFCGVALGYPDHNSPVNNFKTPRISSEDFIRWLD